MKTHETVTLPQYGYVAHPREFFDRALDATRLAESSRDYESRYIADRFLAGSLDADPIDAKVARRYYAGYVAADTYADAVYQVQADKLRARKGLGGLDLQMEYAVELESATRGQR